MDNSVIAKSGWLNRQSKILKKWKRSWVELYRDGHLKYYETNHSPNAEDVIFMPTECVAVKTGAQVEGAQVVPTMNAQCLFSVMATNGKTWIFCGETLDDMRAWQLALEQARLMGVQTRVCAQNPYLQPPPPYSASCRVVGEPSVTYVSQTNVGYPPYYGYPHLSMMGTPLVYSERYYSNPAMPYLWGPLVWW
ncbi:pleckstrin homology domain-containing family B member 2-like isoform X2 [Ornithodoros turicata]|uniref:pleckstrin homology domain-containing family B member 2-like isoform X2 n=1 Tax=Ornithodoros turicata TaxID=34597 RepID=UPI0031395F95